MIRLLLFLTINQIYQWLGPRYSTKNCLRHFAHLSPNFTKSKSPTCCLAFRPQSRLKRSDFETKQYIGNLKCTLGVYTVSKKKVSKMFLSYLPQNSAYSDKSWYLPSWISLLQSTANVFHLIWMSLHYLVKLKVVFCEKKLCWKTATVFKYKVSHLCFLCSFYICWDISKMLTTLLPRTFLNVTVWKKTLLIILRYAHLQCNRITSLAVIAFMSSLRHDNFKTFMVFSAEDKHWLNGC